MTHAPARSGIFLVLAFCWIAGPTAAQSPNAIAVLASDPNLSGLARAIGVGGALTIQGLDLAIEGEIDLELVRFAVFALDAEVWSGKQRIGVPEAAYFRGSVRNWADSRAVLSFKEDGAIDGLIATSGGIWQVSSRLRVSGLAVRRLDLLAESRDRPFDCQTGDAQGGEFLSLLDSVLGGPMDSPWQGEQHSYTARVAVDTDWEFLNRFGGDVTAGTDYVGDLFAFASSIYEAEVDTSLYIGYLKWWPGPNNSSDPWSQSSCSGALSEFRTYWNQNRGGVERTIAHLMSGKSTGCGIAYVGVLCNSSYGYGVTGSLSGNFDPLDPLSGSGFWDIMAVSHEIGHNFGSGHTHCYQGVPDGGYPDAVDHCYDSTPGPNDPPPPPSCYQGTPSLPAGCSPGDRCGTIMSYCHLRSGGYGNISLTFGEGHPHGVDPWRVPAVMSSHVVSRAQSNPACLAVVDPDGIFSDGFESGDLTAWSQSVP